MREAYYRLGRAAALLNTTKYVLRQLWLAHLVKGFTNDNGELMIVASEITRIKAQGIPMIPPKLLDVAGAEEDDFPIEDEPGRGSPGRIAGTQSQVSAPVQQSIDEVLITENQLRRRKLDREREQVEDFFRDRENQKTAMRQAREAAEHERLAATLARVNRRCWEQDWQIRALDYVKVNAADAPRDARLEIPIRVAEALNRTDPDRPFAVVQALVQVAVEKALAPWRRQKAIDRLVNEAVDRLPSRARAYSEPTTWQTRATKGAYEAVRQSDESSSLADLEAVVNHAVDAVALAFEHQELCKQIVRWTSVERATVAEQEEAKEIVRTALAGAPVGASQKRLELIRDEALQPLQERIALRLDQDLRRHVLAMASIPYDFPPALREETLIAVREAWRQIPPGSAECLLEKVRDQVIEQFTATFRQAK